MGFEQVKEFFIKQNMAQHLIVLEQSSATVELAAQALGCSPGRIAKTLSFLVDNHPIVIVVAGDKKIENKKYKHYFQQKAKMIAFDEVESFIGHPPGGVCPFAINKDVKIYLDFSLRTYESVYPAAGSGNTAVHLTIEQLETITKPVAWIDVCQQ